METNLILSEINSFSGEIKENEPLSKHTYYRIGGAARIFAVPENFDDLVHISSVINKFKIPFFVLGAGSNVLVSDQGFNGIVIKLGKINKEISYFNKEDQSYLKIGSSVLVSQLLNKAMDNGWGGLEFLTGIPGTIGGTVVMNAGTHLGESKEALIEVEYIDLQDKENIIYKVKISSDSFSYRKNHFLPKGAIVWSTCWKIKMDQPLSVKTKVKELLSRRKSIQPVNFPSCGSVFKNPKGHNLSAWQVIDKLGLRGYTVGGACFSSKHPILLLTN